MTEIETRSHTSLFGVARHVLVFGTLAALAYFAFDLVSIAFRLGPRVGIRSAVGVALPMVAAGYAMARTPSPGAARSMPVAIAFIASFAGAALCLESIRYFLALMPFPIAELLIASCLAVLLAAARRALDASQAGSLRALALFCGVATGMLLYVALRGVPQVVPG